jgi:uncharacterized repeat protein (TIGR01451 family)
MWDRLKSLWLTSWLSATLLVLVLLTAGVSTSAAPARPANVAPLVWESAAEGEAVSFLVVFRDEADLRGAAAFDLPAERGRFVVDRLRETAQRAQGGVRVLLDRHGADYRPFYVVNAIVATGDRALIEELAARPEVDRIAANPAVRLDLPPPLPIQTVRAPAEIEWNVALVNADDVWALGYHGEGVVVAGQDTGYQWDHPALINQYRGWDGTTATHDYNWHDAIHTNTHGTNVCGVESPVPCDDHSHGTHTMGTIVGDDGADHQIGVAPGAEWIGCRNMDNGWGTPASYIECFEFFIAPYPVGGDPGEGDPAMAPHVINNSWHCPSYEGCDWWTLQATVEAVRAAGIMVVSSAGNSGSACETISTPPALYAATFTVGSVDRYDVIAPSSSRGPVTVDGSGRRKPDISAPGVGVFSSVPVDGYGSKSGTSMAAPHVAGAAALVWSVAPEMVGDVDATEALLEQTARPRTSSHGCGGDAADQVPNNVYGWGIVDALAAVQEVLPPTIGLTITKEVALAPGVAPQHLVYTLTATNIGTTLLTDVVLSDTLPLSTSLIWASGVHTETEGVVVWAPEVLSPDIGLTTTLLVDASDLPAGSVVVNEYFGVRATEVITPVRGAPVAVRLPWWTFCPLVLRND